jgi:hypothetical protein
MTSRRSFLLGIGALVSASFVTRVKAHVFERVSCIRMGNRRLARAVPCLGAGWLGRTPAGSAQADAKQHLTIAAAHLDTVILVVAFARERREEQLTMRVGMPARRVIVGQLHANFVADALAPEIPVEMIEGHGKLQIQTKKWPREAAKAAEQGTLPRSECRVLASGPFRVLLDHATLL